MESGTHNSWYGRACNIKEVGPTSSSDTVSLEDIPFKFARPLNVYTLMIPYILAINDNYNMRQR